jgi:hypothetical protein
METSDHKVIYTYAQRASYSATLSSTTRMVRSGKIADTVNHLRSTNWSAIMKHALVEALDALTTSSPGPDGLSARVLKSTRLELAGIITHLFNVFILIGFSPEQWRDAYLTPIAKVDHPQLWSDYRPISLTSNLCKTFERVLVKRILHSALAFFGCWACICCAKCISDRWMWTGCGLTTSNMAFFLATADAVVQVLFDIG